MSAFGPDGAPKEPLAESDDDGGWLGHVRQQIGEVTTEELDLESLYEARSAKPESDLDELYEARSAKPESGLDELYAARSAKPESDLGDLYAARSEEPGLEPEEPQKVLDTGPGAYEGISGEQWTDLPQRWGFRDLGRWAEHERRIAEDPEAAEDPYAALYKHLESPLATGELRKAHGLLTEHKYLIPPGDEALSTPLAAWDKRPAISPIAIDKAKALPDISEYIKWLGHMNPEERDRYVHYLYPPGSGGRYPGETVRQWEKAMNVGGPPGHTRVMSPEELMEQGVAHGYAPGFTMSKKDALEHFAKAHPKFKDADPAMSMRSGIRTMRRVRPEEYEGVWVAEPRPLYTDMTSTSKKRVLSDQWSLGIPYAARSLILDEDLKVSGVSKTVIDLTGEFFLWSASIGGIELKSRQVLRQDQQAYRTGMMSADEYRRRRKQFPVYSATKDEIYTEPPPTLAEDPDILQKIVRSVDGRSASKDWFMRGVGKLGGELWHIVSMFAIVPAKTMMWAASSDAIDKKMRAAVNVVEELTVGMATPVVEIGTRGLSGWKAGWEAGPIFQHLIVIPTLRFALAPTSMLVAKGLETGMKAKFPAAVSEALQSHFKMGKYESSSLDNMAKSLLVSNAMEGYLGHLMRSAAGKAKMAPTQVRAMQMMHEWAREQFAISYSSLPAVAETVAKWAGPLWWPINAGRLLFDKLILRSKSKTAQAIAYAFRSPEHRFSAELMSLLNEARNARSADDFNLAMARLNIPPHLRPTVREVLGHGEGVAPMTLRAADIELALAETLRPRRFFRGEQAAELTIKEQRRIKLRQETFSEEIAALKRLDKAIKESPTGEIETVKWVSEEAAVQKVKEQGGHFAEGVWVPKNQGSGAQSWNPWTNKMEPGGFQVNPDVQLGLGRTIPSRLAELEAKTGIANKYGRMAIDVLDALTARGKRVGLIDASIDSVLNAHLPMVYENLGGLLDVYKGFLRRAERMKLSPKDKRAVAEVEKLRDGLKNQFKQGRRSRQVTDRKMREIGIPVDIRQKVLGMSDDFNVEWAAVGQNSTRVSYFELFDKIARSRGDKRQKGQFIKFEKPAGPGWVVASEAPVKGYTPIVQDPLFQTYTGKPSVAKYWGRLAEPTMVPGDAVVITIGKVEHRLKVNPDGYITISKHKEGPTFAGKPPRAKPPGRPRPAKGRIKVAKMAPGPLRAELLVEGLTVPEISGLITRTLRDAGHRSRVEVSGPKLHLRNDLFIQIDTSRKVIEALAQPMMVFNRIFKASRTYQNPMVAGRNFFDVVFVRLPMAGVSPFNPTHWKLITEATKEFSSRKSFKDNPLFMEMYKSGLFGGDMFTSEFAYNGTAEYLGGTIGHGADFASRIWEIITGPLEMATGGKWMPKSPSGIRRPMSENLRSVLMEYPGILYGNIDNWGKFIVAKFYHEVKGMSIKDAARLARQHNLDYGSVAGLVSAMRAPIPGSSALGVFWALAGQPFFTFLHKSLPRMQKWLESDPIQAAIWESFYTQFETSQLATDDVPREYSKAILQLGKKWAKGRQIPLKITKGLPDLPGAEPKFPGSIALTTSNVGWLGPANSLMVEDELWGNESIFDLIKTVFRFQSPMTSVAMGVFGNRNPYSDYPIRTRGLMGESEEATTIKHANDLAVFLVGHVVPPIFPGMYEHEVIVKALRGEAGPDGRELGTWGALARIMGQKVTKLYSHEEVAGALGQFARRVRESKNIMLRVIKKEKGVTTLPYSLIKGREKLKMDAALGLSAQLAVLEYLDQMEHIPQQNNLHGKINRGMRALKRQAARFDLPKELMGGTFVHELLDVPPEKPEWGHDTPQKIVDWVNKAKGSELRRYAKLNKSLLNVIVDMRSYITDVRIWQHKAQEAGQY